MHAFRARRVQIAPYFCGRFSFGWCQLEASTLGIGWEKRKALLFNLNKIAIFSELKNALREFCTPVFFVSN